MHDERTNQRNERTEEWLPSKKLKGKTEKCTCRYLFIKEDNEIKVFKSAEWITISEN